MTLCSDWPRYAVPQRHARTGCIPTGYEFLLRAAGVEGIDFATFQDEFDLEFAGTGQNNFQTVALAIQARYPLVSIGIEIFGRGADKLGFIEQRLSRKQLLLLSLTLRQQGGWHIAPIVDADSENLYLLWEILPDREAKVYELSRCEGQ